MLHPHLIRHFREPHQREVCALLDDPSAFPGLAPLKPEELLVQAFAWPSFRPIKSWNIYRNSRAGFIARRVRWDFWADCPPSFHGADAHMDPHDVDTLLSELGAISIPALARQEKGITLDGNKYSVRVPNCCFTWDNHAPPGCQALESWFQKFVKTLDDELPAETNPYNSAEAIR